MEIVLRSLLEGARKAQGTTVIIDVFRAFTTAAVAFSRGATRIVLVAEVEEALELRRRGAGEVCMGEVGGMRPEGFDYGNSPYALSQAEVAGKSLIQSTRAGTVGVAAAAQASEVYAASLAVAGATARAIIRDSPDRVTIVAMGAEGKERADEDEQCALYLRNRIQGRTPDRAAVQSLVLSGAEAQKYSDPARPHFDPRDREMAIDVDAFPFAIKVTREDGLLIATPVYV